MKGVRDMKKWLLYMLSVVLCTGLFSCTAYEEMTDIPPTGKEGEVKVSFVLNIPSSRGTTDGSDLDENYFWERYINERDIRAFVFIGDEYQEEVKRLIIEGDDGNQIRTITGMISNQYEGREVQLVVLTNMASRGVKTFTLTPGMSKDEVYEKLVYKYNEAWTFSEAETESYIPMWGISAGFEIKPDVLNDAGEIYMYRAIAKIDIKVNDGKGIDNFTIKKIELLNVPSVGYCASLNYGEVNVEKGEAFKHASVPVNEDDRLEYIADPLPVFEGDEKYKIENRIYVPEMTKYKPYPYFRIRIHATAGIYEDERVYDLYMRDKQTDPQTSFEVLRNHKYVINIKTITSTDEVKVGYHINTWGQGTNVDIPFN